MVAIFLSKEAKLQATISVKNLNMMLNDPNLRLFDTRFALSDTDAGFQLFVESHLPGAQYLHLDKDLSGVKTPHSGRHPLPLKGDFQTLMQRCGVDKDSQIVIYDASRCAFASRLWWLCRYYGLEHVRVLEGGWQAWRSANLPLSSAQVEFPRSHWVATTNQHMTADIETVRLVSKQGGCSLIDAREEPRYLGLEEPIDPIAGHIPGAINVPWKSMTDDLGHFHQERELESLWADIDKDPIVYCGSGVTACVDILALHQAGKSARLYPGSWSQWCSYMI